MGTAQQRLARFATTSYDPSLRSHFKSQLYRASLNANIDVLRENGQELFSNQLINRRATPDITA